MSSPPNRSNLFSFWYNKTIGVSIPAAAATYVKTPIAESTPNEETELLCKQEAVGKHTNQWEHDAYTEYKAIKRNLMLKKTRSAIGTYDEKKLSASSDYKTFAYNCDNEVDAADVNTSIDNALDIEQMKKLGICNLPEDTSDKRKEELKKQQAIYDERESARLSSLNALRARLAEYDAKQSGRENYKSFEQQCKENEEDTDEETDDGHRRNKKEEDDEMDRILMEKLGIYKEEKERREVQQKRLQRSKAIDLKIREHNKHQREHIKQALERLDQYHEHNKERDRYRAFNCSSEEDTDDDVMRLISRHKPKQ